MKHSSLLLRTKSSPDFFSEGHFSAKPFPAQIFTGYVYEQMKATRAYRDVQKSIRQNALLASASLPPRMKAAAASEAEKNSAMKQQISQNRKKQQVCRIYSFFNEQNWLSFNIVGQRPQERADQSTASKISHTRA